MSHPERHRSHRAGWLRAAVLGANDGIVSTSSLLIGVAAAGSAHENILISGGAALVAGAMSMAAGEYVSVSSQADSERADLAIEWRSLQTDPRGERDELARIYEGRGLAPALALQVADQLMAHDALGAHARDDIGLSEAGAARPISAALSSAASFAAGAAAPLAVAWAMPNQLTAAVASVSLACLALLGAVAARTGGASMRTGALRVTFWGALAMALTAAIGQLFGVVA
ncbi:MAG TPA: VIT family protein [Fontimonas sp.]